MKFSNELKPGAPNGCQLALGGIVEDLFVVCTSTKGDFVVDVLTVSAEIDQCLGFAAAERPLAAQLHFPLSVKSMNSLQMIGQFQFCLEIEAALLFAGGSRAGKPIVRNVLWPAVK